MPGKRELDVREVRNLLIVGSTGRDTARAAAASAMLVIASLAALGPAWAATRADPVEALRLE